MASSDLKRVGIVFAADGTTDFKNSLKDVNSTLKANQNEFKKATQAYDKNTTQVQKLRDQYKLAQAQMETYGDKCTLLKGQLEQLQSAEKDNFTAMQNQKKAVDDLQSELDELVKSEGAESEAVKEKKAELEAAQSSLEKLTDKENKYNSQIKTTQTNLDTASISMQKFADEADKTQKSLTDGSAALQDMSKGLKDASEKTGKVGDVMTKGVTAPIAAAGTAAVASWKTVDDMLDTVTKKVGTGSAEMAQNIAKAEAQVSNFSLEDIGTAVGEVNTRFGVTGEKLQELSDYFLKFAEVNDADVNSSIDSTQKVMEAFNLSVEDTPALLDKITEAAQNSGISTDTLTSEMISYGAALKSAGMSAGSAVDFLANLEKSGADSGTVLSGFNKVLQNATNDGISAQQALSNLFTTIEQDGGTSADVVDLFGKKGGSAIAQMLQDGTLTQDMFTSLGDTLTSSLGNVENTYAAIQDPIDNLQNVQNQFNLAMADLGETLLPTLVDLIQQLVPLIQEFSTWWNGLDDGTKDLIVKMALFAAATGPVLKGLSGVLDIASKLTGSEGFAGLIAKLTEAGTGAASMGSVFLTVGKGIISIMTGPVGIIAAAVAVFAFLYTHCEGFRDFINGLLEGIKDGFLAFGKFIKGLIDSITGWFKDAFGWLGDKIDSLKKKWADSGIGKFVSKVGSGVKDFFGGGISWNASGGILTHPTIFGANGGQLLGGGEAGKEAVLPIDNLQGYMQAVNDQQSQELIAAMTDAVKAGVYAALTKYAPTVQLDGSQVGQFVDGRIKKAYGR